MENLWKLIFGADETIPLLTRNVGSEDPVNPNNINLSLNKAYEGINADDIDPINVKDDFSWTVSPKSSKTDVPYVRMIERRITQNTNITNLAYSLLALSEAGEQGILGGLTADPSNLVDSTIIRTALNNDIIQSVGNNVSETLSVISDKIEEAKQKISLFNSSVLQPYNGLYVTEDTGFEYWLPYFDDSYKDFSNNFGDSNNDLFSDVLQAGQTFLSNVNRLNLALRPGVYVEESQAFRMEQQGPSISLSFPLLNTLSFEDVVKNWQFIFGLIYQNKPGRITKSLIDIPVIYTVAIPGIAYYPYAYISNLSVKFLGSRRNMKIPVPATGADIGVSRQGLKSQNIDTIIPDSYQIDITIKSLNEETRNFMYESINPGLVTAETYLEQLEEENANRVGADDARERALQSSQSRREIAIARNNGNFVVPSNLPQQQSIPDRGPDLGSGFRG